MYLPRQLSRVYLGSLVRILHLDPQYGLMLPNMLSTHNDERVC